jgi:hypothetical protein
MKYCLQYAQYIYPTKHIGLLVPYQSKLNKEDYTYVVPSLAYAISRQQQFRHLTGRMFVV